MRIEHKEQTRDSAREGPAAEAGLCARTCARAFLARYTYATCRGRAERTQREGKEKTEKKTNEREEAGGKRERERERKGRERKQMRSQEGVLPRRFARA